MNRIEGEGYTEKDGNAMKGKFVIKREYRNLINPYSLFPNEPELSPVAERGPSADLHEIWIYAISTMALICFDIRLLRFSRYPMLL